MDELVSCLFSLCCLSCFPDLTHLLFHRYYVLWLTLEQSTHTEFSSPPALNYSFIFIPGVHKVAELLTGLPPAQTLLQPLQPCVPAAWLLEALCPHCSVGFCGQFLWLFKQRPQASGFYRSHDVQAQMLSHRAERQESVEQVLPKTLRKRRP